MQLALRPYLELERQHGIPLCEALRDADFLRDNPDVNLPVPLLESLLELDEELLSVGRVLDVDDDIAGRVFERSAFVNPHAVGHALKTDAAELEPISR